MSSRVALIAASLLAATEFETARQTLDLAMRAKDTLQDVAEIDHLAYLARQRIAISGEAAALRSAGKAR